MQCADIFGKEKLAVWIFSGHIEDLFLSKTCRSQYVNDENASSQNILPNCGEYTGV